MAQRSRKRGRRGRPSASARNPTKPSARTPAAPGAHTPAAAGAQLSARTPAPPGATAPPTRSQRRDAEVRRALQPLGPGERPWAVKIGAGLAAAAGAGNMIAWVAGAKIAGKHPAAGGIIVFSVLMLVCAVGMWRMWYGAVLAFMALLALITMFFALLLIEASNLLGFLVPPVVIAGAGFLFYKLVRTLSRIQMPRYPGR